MSYSIRITTVLLEGLAASSLASAAMATTVAQWQMDNTFGTTMEDYSGNGNNGTMYNVVTSGGGYIFDGTTSKVVVPNSASLNPGASNFTFTVQIQTDRVPPAGTDYDLLRKGTSIKSGGEYKVEIVENRGLGKAFCAVKDAAGNVASIRGTTNVADNNLHTITCTKTSTGLTIRVDALAPRTRSASLTGSINNSKALTIGVKTPTLTGVDADWYNGTFRSATISVDP
jgi:hypothetical protein